MHEAQLEFTVHGVHRPFVHAEYPGPHDAKVVQFFRQIPDAHVYPAPQLVELHIHAAPFQYGMVGVVHVTHGTEPDVSHILHWVLLQYIPIEQFVFVIQFEQAVPLQYRSVGVHVAHVLVPVASHALHCLLLQYIPIEQFVFVIQFEQVVPLQYGSVGAKHVEHLLKPVASHALHWLLLQYIPEEQFVFVIQFAHAVPVAQYGCSAGHELHVEIPSYLHSVQKFVVTEQY